jgi:hypothetical protein
VNVTPRPNLRGLAVLLWQYVRLCAVAVLFVVLILGIPLALCVAMWCHS